MSQQVVEAEISQLYGIRIEVSYKWERNPKTTTNFTADHTSFLIPTIPIFQIL